MLTALLPFRGEIAALAAAFIWAGTITIYMRIGRDLPALSINFFKNAFGILCFLALMAYLREPWPSDNLWPILALTGSGILGLTVGDTLFFYAMKRCGTQVSSSIQCLGPVFAALGAWAVRGETMTGQQWAGVLITISAILMVVQGQALRQRSYPSEGPSKAAMTSGILIAVASAGVNGAGVVVARIGFQHFTVLQGTTIRLTAATLGLAVIFGWRREWPMAFQKVLAPRQLGYLALASFGGTFLGLLLLSTGIAYSKAGIASALSSTYPIWLVPLSWFVLKEKSHPLSLLGTLVAVGGMALLFLS